MSVCASVSFQRAQPVSLTMDFWGMLLNRRLGKAQYCRGMGVVPGLSLERALLSQDPVARVGARAIKIAATTLQYQCSPMLCGGSEAPHTCYDCHSAHCRRCGRVGWSVQSLPPSVMPTVAASKSIPPFKSQPPLPLSRGTLVVECLEIAKISLK